MYKGEEWIPCRLLTIEGFVTHVFNDTIEFVLFSIMTICYFWINITTVSNPFPLEPACPTHPHTGEFINSRPHLLTTNPTPIGPTSVQNKIAHMHTKKASVPSKPESGSDSDPVFAI